ncbi:MAG: right-handed parallel beta-helix repeat-containing protein [Prevotella sp.]|nr:right-handed parallel beta-helix repeat-containing protein [Prevotella sp.]
MRTKNRRNRWGVGVLLALWVQVAQASGQYTITVQPGEFTIEQALQQARLNRLQGGLDRPVLQLQPGTYRLSQPVVLRPEDSLTTIVAPRGQVVVSGGVQIKGWRKKGRLWVADVPLWNGRPLEFRQLWVNGRKAVRARDIPVRAATPGGDPFERMNRIVSVDKLRETIYIPRKAIAKLSPLTPHLSPLTSHHSPLELVLHEMWCVANLRIKSWRAEGDSVALTFHNPESHVHFMHPWPSPMVTPGGEHNSAFYLTGALELLDEPGEWHLDIQARRLYYMPLPGEDMTTATVEAPALQTLLAVEGTPDQPVRGVTLRGITFSHATWLRPSLAGHAPLQAGMYMTEAYKIRPQISRPNGDHKLDNQGWVGRPAAAVSLNCAEGVSFIGCTFEHTASTALDYHLYIKGGSVSRCTFADIGGTAVLAGSFGSEGHEAHLPYDPTDRRETCTGLCISDNRIDDAANEDWGCIGIAAGFVRGIRIEHNEISNVSYTGISLGWGWNQQTCAMADNTVRGNYIHHYARHMYDTAAIYTLGSQPHTVVEENVADSICTPTYVHDPQHWFYLYTDEGSSYITVRNNWTPSDKFLRNANGPGCTWENNGPQVADSIKVRAGVRKER